MNQEAVNQEVVRKEADKQVKRNNGKERRTLSLLVVSIFVAILGAIGLPLLVVFVLREWPATTAPCRTLPWQILVLIIAWLAFLIAIFSLALNAIHRDD
jgi:peptidoglycan biosynthesis protein MviN/MurJ (putative lipid II flippase)